MRSCTELNPKSQVLLHLLEDVLLRRLQLVKLNAPGRLQTEHFVISIHICTQQNTAVYGLHHLLIGLVIAYDNKCTLVF